MRHDYGYFEEDHLVSVGELSLWRRILGYVRPHATPVAGAVFLSLVITATGLVLPYLVSIAIDRYIVNQDLGIDLRIHGLGRVALFFFGFIVLEFFANLFQVVLLEWTGQHVMHRLRQDLFRHLLDLDLPFFHRNPVGKLVTRVTNDIQNMHEMFTSVIVTLFNDLVRVVGILAILFWMNWRMALILCLLVPVIAANTIWFGRLARNVFREIRTSLARLNSYLQESLSGLEIIQLYLREKDAAERFTALNRGYFSQTIRQITLFGIFMPLLEVLATVAVALVIWYGGGEIVRNRMSIGVLVAFLSYMRLFFQPLRELSQKYSIVQSAMASAERIFQLMDSRPGLKSAASPLRPETVSGAVRFQNVTFGYEPGRPVLEDFSLAIAAGETVAVVGPTGAGKSTLINLLERFYDPEQGEIFFDDTESRRLDLFWLRSRIGLVMQDVFILPDTVRENILLGREISGTSLDEVLEQAQFAGVVRGLPQGLDTRIGEGGTALSAGQRQLLALARVLVRDPRILILDEATSSVDTETEMLLETALERVMAGRTSIIIAHRLSTIRRADRILVLQKGKIVEQGDHLELMRKNGLYRRLQDLQHTEYHGVAPEGTG